VADRTGSTGEISGSAHLMDYRVSLPVPFAGQCYLVVLAGRERRNEARLAAEGYTRPSRQATVYSIALVLLLAFSTFGILSFLYIIKSLVGIDLFDGPSTLHPLYALLTGR
jgi:hypothetical protein